MKIWRWGLFPIGHVLFLTPIIVTINPDFCRCYVTDWIASSHFEHMDRKESCAYKLTSVCPVGHVSVLLFVPFLCLVFYCKTSKLVGLSLVSHIVTPANSHRRHGVILQVMFQPEMGLVWFWFQIIIFLEKHAFQILFSDMALLTIRNTVQIWGGGYRFIA